MRDKRDKERGRRASRRREWSEGSGEKKRGNVERRREKVRGGSKIIKTIFFKFYILTSAS
jgi:hypothetical protein